MVAPRRVHRAGRSKIGRAAAHQNPGPFCEHSHPVLSRLMRAVQDRDRILVGHRSACFPRSPHLGLARAHLWRTPCQPLISRFGVQGLSARGCLRRSRPSLARPGQVSEGRWRRSAPPGAFVGAVRAKQGEGYGWPIALRCREPETVAFRTSSRSPCSNIYSGITRKAARMESAGSR